MGEFRCSQLLNGFKQLQVISDGFIQFQVVPFFILIRVGVMAGKAKNFVELYFYCGPLIRHSNLGETDIGRFTQFSDSMVDAVDFPCPRLSKIPFQYVRRSNQQQEQSHIMVVRNSVKEARVRHWEKIDFALAHQTSLPALLACLGFSVHENCKK